MGPPSTLCTCLQLSLHIPAARAPTVVLPRPLCEHVGELAKRLKLCGSVHSSHGPFLLVLKHKADYAHELQQQPPFHPSLTLEAEAPLLLQRSCSRVHCSQPLCLSWAVLRSS